MFVQSSENHFEPRDVETGWQLGDRIEIVKGLKEGDVVVASGTFLVDSESRLHAKQSAENPIKNAAPMNVAMARRVD